MVSQTASSRMEEYLAARQQSQRRDLLICLGAITAALMLLAAAGALVRPLNEIRRENQFVLDAESLKGLPPDIELLTKTGTLRALAVDLAFIRLENLKQENRFYELMQLSDWLCKLAPRYPKVWQYSAWNMAYNISVSQYTPEARWLWVSNGIDNLRRQGLRYNPKSITLYKELAWIFIHKIGEKLDDYHAAYKSELAFEMEQILGEPPLMMSEDQVRDELRKICDAPRDLDQWISQTPAATSLVAQLREVGLDADRSLLSFVARYMRTYSSTTEFATEPRPQEQTEPLARRRAVLARPENAATVDTLLAALRWKVLDEELNMNPEWMLELMKEFGPIDWRTPFAHALYWATYGDMVTQGSLVIDEADSMNTVRLIFHSLERMTTFGRVFFEPNFDKPNRSFLQMLPDSRFIKHMHRAYLDYGERQFGDDPRFKPGTAGPNYSAGHRNFLMNAIRHLYLEGGEENLAEAKEYFFYLRKFDTEENGEVKAQYQMTFDEFALQTMYEALETQANAIRFIASLLERSLKDLADGDVSASVAHFYESRKWWNYYMRDLQYDRNERRTLEPIGIIRRDVAATFMSTPAYSALQKARMWAALDTLTRRAIYDAVLPSVQKQCELHDPPLDPDKVMPAPPGMKEYRADPNRYLKELERFDETVQTGEKLPQE